MKRYAWIAFEVISCAAQAQSVNTSMGGRSAAMAYAGVVLTDESSLFNNVGAMANVDQPSAFFAQEVSPSLPGAARTSAGFIVPTRPGTFGAGLFRFGDDLHSEQIARTAFSNKLGIASLGLSVQYIQYMTEGYPTKGAFTIDFGGYAQISPQISVGARIQNLGQASFSPDELLPVSVTAGIGFKASSLFFASTQIEKDLAYPATWRAGAEYMIHKKLLVRSGFSINPNSAFFGMGFKSTRLKADYALQFNAILGESHQVSTAIRLDNKKKK